MVITRTTLSPLSAVHSDGFRMIIMQMWTRALTSTASGDLCGTIVARVQWLIPVAHDTELFCIADPAIGENGGLASIA